MMASPGWAAARRILCVRLDNMGDVLMSSPAMRALKSLPGRPTLTLLASRSGASAAPFLPQVDDVLVHDAAWVKNDGQGNEQDRALIGALEAGQFDAAVIFTVYTQSALPAALMCHLAGIPLVLAHSRENPYRLLSDWVPESEPGVGVRHEVQRQLDLVAHIGASTDDTQLTFRTRSSDRQAVTAHLLSLGVDTEKGWIVAHCGATAASRRYSPEKFAAALAGLKGAGLPILLTGDESEQNLLEDVIARCPGGMALFNLAGRFSLGQLGCLIEGARLLISNNTGPVHIAAAVQTPVVDLYALTNPQHTPWQVEHRVLFHDVPCKYCYRSVCPKGHNDCLQKIPPQSVADAALELLQEQSVTSCRTAVA